LLVSGEEVTHAYLLYFIYNIFLVDADLEQDKLQVIEFFRFQKLPKGIAEQFLANGYDTVLFVIENLKRMYTIFSVLIVLYIHS
jgi:hypothetical protein